jgi:SAM-dependent methyltransferase
MHVPTDWFTSFFMGPALQVTQQLYSADCTRAEADFIVEQLALTGDAALLDVPCGDGRLSLNLAARGYRLTGIDLAAPLIERARAAAARRQLPATFEARDMRDLPAHGMFDGAFCCGNSFAYLDDAGNAEFLRAISGALKPGARFLLDYPAVAEALLPHLERRAWYPVGDILMLAEREYDPVRGRLDVEYSFVHNGIIDKRPASYRIYAYRQVSELLADAGFIQPVGYGSLTGEPFALGARGLYMLATRR